MPKRLRSIQRRRSSRPFAISCAIASSLQIATNIVVITGLGDFEGSHKLRGGLHRLRCAFSIVSPVVVCPEMEQLNNWVRWFGQEAVD